MGNMPTTAMLAKKEFQLLSTFIQSEFGIKMPPVKKTLLESRLQKRLRLLNLQTFKEYCDYLFSEEGRIYEIPHFIDKITTNKTDFFREPEHFEYLLQSVMPVLIENWGARQKPLQIWSAGCSTGEEPYTLAMVLSNFMTRHPNLKMAFSILGTDISEEVITTAGNAVYEDSKIDTIPMHFRKVYLLKSLNRDKKYVRMTPEIRKLIQFKRINLMDNDLGIKQLMDIIFCRNVIIYFNKETQETILNRLCKNLVPGGYFFQGHSESMHGLKLPLKQVFPTIYQKIS